MLRRDLLRGGLAAAAVCALPLAATATAAAPVAARAGLPMSLVGLHVARDLDYHWEPVGDSQVRSTHRACG